MRSSCGKIEKNTCHEIIKLKEFRFFWLMGLFKRQQTTTVVKDLHIEHQCTVVEGVWKSQDDFFYFFTYYGRFGYGKTRLGKTHGEGNFNEFDQNFWFLVL